MDPRLLKYYNGELQHLREMGGEFAAEFPKIAGRLGLDGFECADPYVERLLEGFAFLAARVQLKIDAEFPRFTQHLLEIVYPHYMAPMPSMAVVRFQPNLNEGTLAEGYRLPRGSVLRSRLGRGEQTACEYRTAHEVTLWPLELAEAEYFTRDTATAIELPNARGIKAGLRLRLRTTAGLNFNELTLEQLTVYLRGGGELAMRLYEQLMASAKRIVIRPARRGAEDEISLDARHLRPVGFGDDEALLPYTPLSFQGYRLLDEYFAFPERFLSVELDGLGPVVRRCTGNELDIFILLDRADRFLESALDVDDFALFCTPAVNLFPRRADRIHLNDRQSEFHIIPDRTRPMDFEVYRVTELVGYGTGGEEIQTFRPFYAATDAGGHAEEQAYYALHRVPRLLSAKQRQTGPRSSYVGSEVYVSLVDARDAPYRHDLRQLAIGTLCTNRDLPLQMPLGVGETDFTLESGAPVAAVRCLAGPTRPRQSLAMMHGETAWRLVSHLSLNYLSLTDSDEQGGAAALRDLLRLYADTSESPLRKQVEGVRSIQTVPVTRRLPVAGPITFGRGLELGLTLDEAAFEGSGVYLLGAVLEQFFSRYVTINSFTETVLRTIERGEVKRWPARIGRRPTL